MTFPRPIQDVYPGRVEGKMNKGGGYKKYFIANASAMMG